MRYYGGAATISPLLKASLSRRNSWGASAPANQPQLLCVAKFQQREMKAFFELAGRGVGKHVRTTQGGVGTPSMAFAHDVRLPHAGGRGMRGRIRHHSRKTCRCIRRGALFVTFVGWRGMPADASNPFRAPTSGGYCASAATSWHLQQEFFGYGGLTFPRMLSGLFQKFRSSSCEVREVGQTWSSAPMITV